MGDLQSDVKKSWWKNCWVIGFGIVIILGIILTITIVFNPFARENFQKGFNQGVSQGENK